MKKEIKQILEMFTKEQAKEQAKINSSHIYRLKEEIKQMLEVSKTGNFVNDVHKKDFYERLNKKNSLLNYFEQQNLLFIKAHLI